MLYGQSVTTPQSSPLTDAEKTQILIQLMALRDMKLIDVPKYEASIKQLEATVALQQATGKEAVENERKATAAAQLERDAYKERAAFLEAALKAKTQKRSFGCTLKKVFTLGISGCR